MGQQQRFSRIKKRSPVRAFSVAIAISYHCPVAAMPCTRAVKPGGAAGPRVSEPGGDRGEGGTKKGQMAPSFSQPSGSGHAPTESEHLPLLPRSRAQENHRLFSSLARQKAHPPTDTEPAVGVCRGPQFLISYLFRSAVLRHPPPPPATSVSSFIPRRGTLQDFQFWQMARARQKDHPLSSVLLFLLFLGPL